MSRMPVDLAEEFDRLNTKWKCLAPGGMLPDFADIGAVAMVKYGLHDTAIALLHAAAIEPDGAPQWTIFGMC